MPAGISERNRTLLDRLHRAAAGPFTAIQAAKWLSLDATRSRRFLAHLVERGWLARVRQGLYAVVPLGASEPSAWREDPWIVAERSFAPCYIGGWSACEHWGLTEQIFRDVVVFTARPMRKRSTEIQGTPFRLKLLPKGEHFGTVAVWRDRVRVRVSDPSRTLVDILDDPALGGGIGHVSAALVAYFDGEHRDDAKLVEYASRRSNRTVFKRLGYLVETLSIEAADVVASCRNSMSSGVTLLDPTIGANGRIVKRWNLRVNAEVRTAGRET
jgi:predicted transcriptional regulator of viral defense system